MADFGISRLNERDATLMVMYYAAIEQYGIDQQEWVKTMSDWDIIPLKRGDLIIGGVMQRGTELHVAFQSRPTFSTRGYLRRILNSTIERLGSATTTVRAANQHGLAMCHRLGFETVREAEGIIYLKCERARYA